MSRKYNFVFLYEVKNRELESILLLKTELKRRGYSVCIIETWERELKLKTRVRADVLVTFALYNDETVKYVLSFVKGCNKIINMQWEQIFTNGDAKRIIRGENVSNAIRGKAVYGKHIAWGPETCRKLIDTYGVSPENVCNAGNITFDFLRRDMRSFYRSRRRIFEKYGLNPEKKVYLFISSFSYVDLPDNIISSDTYQNVGFDIDLFQKVAIESQKKIIDWFALELEKHPDVEVIYRPHPAEYGNESLVSLCSRYANFHIISDMSIKQWILISDKIYTWWSTSIAEVFASGKGCSILRPIEIPYEADIELYQSCEKITTFEQFDREFLFNNDFPISEQIIRQYYYFDPKEPCFIKIVNYLEAAYLEKNKYVFSCDTNLHEGMERIIIVLKNRVKAVLAGHSALYFGVRFIMDLMKIMDKKKMDLRMEEYRYTKKMYDNNKYSPAEDKMITGRIDHVLKNREYNK